MIVIPHLSYLTSLRNDASHRRQLLTSITPGQIAAISEVAKRLIDGTIGPIRGDIRVFSRNRLALRALASNRVSDARKKNVLLRHLSLIPVLLREIYLMLTIVEEMHRAIRG